MDLLKLKYFYTIAKYENISTATKELFISQSALSKSLKTLEEELEMDLFFRNGKRIVLNDNGKFLYERIKPIFTELENLEKAIEEQKKEANRKLRIVATLPYFLDLFDTFVMKYPEIHFQQIPLLEENLTKFVENGQFDVCLTTEEVIHPNVKWIPLYEEEILLFVPDSFSQFSDNEIDIQELKDLPFIGLTNRYQYRQLIDKICLEYNFTPNYKIEVEDSISVIQLVKNGNGVAFMPLSAVNHSEKNIKYLRIKNGSMKRTLGLLLHNTNYQKKITKKFIEHCKEYFAECQMNAETPI